MPSKNPGRSVGTARATSPGRARVLLMAER
jgi:hypothetical protein